MSTVAYAKSISRTPRCVRKWCEAGLIGRRVGGRWEIDEGTQPPTSTTLPRPVVKLPELDLGFPIRLVRESCLNTNVVYFVELAGHNFVKIGFTSQLSCRLAKIQTGSPFAVKLLLAYEADKIHERDLHLRFNDDRVRVNGEWFRYSRAIGEFISAAWRAPQ